MKLLLHTCCAPCSAAILEYLCAGGIRPVLFYYNPNIYPRGEYEVRRDECRRYAGKLGLDCIDGDYDHAMWLKDIAGFEKEPERGNRCRECFRIRLEATAHLAGATGFDTVATTLGSSRWKSLEQIAAAGHRATAGYPKLTFWDRNWRKGGLSERRNSLLKENGFYNQQYCGCEFSGMLPAK